MFCAPQLSVCSQSWQRLRCTCHWSWYAGRMGSYRASGMLTIPFLRGLLYTCFFSFLFFFLFLLIHFSCILFRVKWNSNKLSSFSTNLSSFEQFESTFVITHQLGFLNVFKRDESLCVSLLIKTTTRSCKNKLVDLFLKRSSFFRDFLHLCNVLFAWYLFVVRLSFEHAKGRKSLSMPLVSAISFQLALQSVLINVWNVVIYVDCVPVYFHFPMYFGNQVLDTKQRLNLLFNLS